MLEAENTTRPVKKSPAFKLTSKLQRETDLMGLVRESVLAVTLPLKSLLGLDGTKMQDLIISLMKRKRVVPDTDRSAAVTKIEAGPVVDGTGYVYGDKEEEYVHCLAARGHGAFTEEHETEDYRKSYWSRATPAIMINFAGINESVPVLIDHGSEINVMSWEIYAMADPGYPMDPHPGWSMKTANGGVSKMLGACTGVSVSIGSTTVGHNFFVQGDVSFPVILGQPWIHKM